MDSPAIALNVEERDTNMRRQWVVTLVGFCMLGLAARSCQPVGGLPVKTAN